MIYLNLPYKIDLFISRLKAKSYSDEYTIVYNYFNSLKKTTWYNLPNLVKDIVVGISLYQVEAIDGDLQDLIDELQNITWFNILSKITLIKQATELIETL